MNIERIMASLEAKHPGESEYLQAVKEVKLCACSLLFVDGQRRFS